MVCHLKWIEFEVFRIAETSMVIDSTFVSQKVIVNLKADFKWPVFNELDFH